MSEKKVYLAVDLGAGSGRVMAGEFDGEKIELRELNRFENNPIELPDGWRWNINELYQNILIGLRLAHKHYGDSLVSVAVDTWGVDYGLLDGKGELLGLPFQYRDRRTDGMMEKGFAKVPKEDLYAATGTQMLFFNTIWQLLAEYEAKDPIIQDAESLLFMPDLISFWLSGEKSQERTFASTTQLYNPTTRDWDWDLIKKLELPKHLFSELSDPGTVLGDLSPSVCQETGIGKIKVVTVAGHDTASAVAAVPSQSEAPAYLSSGTWSLMGLELPQPVISDQSFEDSFTNEVGIGHTIRFLKNICGLWLIQESKRYWASQGESYSFAELASFTDEAEAFRSFINPDDPRFEQAGKMPEKVADYCRETGQRVPETPGEIVRCITESLALRYAEVWEKLIQYVDEPPKEMHVVGGGSQNSVLNQLTADALGVVVKAGPVEATSLGNVIAQMMADGTVGSLAEGRALVAKSFPVEVFEPRPDEMWQQAREIFATFTKSE